LQPFSAAKSIRDESVFGAKRLAQAISGLRAIRVM